MPQSTQLVASDLRVHPSLRMHDHADGGGAISGTPLKSKSNKLNPEYDEAREILSEYGRTTSQG